MKVFGFLSMLLVALVACTRTEKNGLPACQSRVPELGQVPAPPTTAEPEYVGEITLALTVEKSGLVSAVRAAHVELKPSRQVTGPPSREVAAVAAAARNWRFVPQHERCVSLQTTVFK